MLWLTVSALQGGAVEFLARLAELQKAVGLSDAAFEKAIGKGGNYLGRLKKEKLPVPDEGTVRKMGEELQRRGADITPDALWALALPDKADDSVREHFLAELEKSRQDFERRLAESARIDPEEQRVVEALRAWRPAIERYAERRIAANPTWPREAVEQRHRIDPTQTVGRFLELTATRDAEVVTLLHTLQLASLLPEHLRKNLVETWAKATAGMFSAWKTENPRDALRNELIAAGNPAEAVDWWLDPET
jgi:hypothetical protein